jgi:quinol-cytochrome oxidoreductase complex cytochrome b subunit
MEDYMADFGQSFAIVYITCRRALGLHILLKNLSTETLIALHFAVGS